MSLPIRTRITAWYVVLLTVVVSAVGAFLVVRLRADLTGSVDATLRPASGQVAVDYAAEGVADFRDAAGTVLTGERAAAQLLDPAAGRVMIAFGDPVARAPMARADDWAAALAGGTVITTRRLGRDGQSFRVLARRVAFRGRPAVLVAGQSLAPVERSVDRVVVLLLLACPVALLATALGGAWLARRALRPVERITSTAEGIGVDRLDERVAEPRARDEIAHLARTLNTMLDRIQHGVEEQRRLVADASHELRTPLAAMRAEIDVSLLADDLEPAARGVLESAREEVDRMARTVDALLTLAIADDGDLDMRLGVVDLAALSEEVLERLRPIAAERGVTLELLGERVGVLADASRLAEAVRNVVENAIAFSPGGGDVVVTIAGHGRTGRITVADEGGGVPADLHERIFDRFFRADRSRARSSGGSGLGLAITREIVGAHGGRVWVDGHPGAGAVFVIEVPRASAGVERGAGDTGTPAPGMLPA
jgi:heavy metal sensor kinase